MSIGVHPEGATGSSGSIDVLDWSPADFMANRAVAVLETAFDQTCGGNFLSMARHYVTGIKVKPLTTRDVKVTLWDYLGSVLATATGSATGGQWNTIFFATPYQIAAADIGRLHYFGAWIVDQSSPRAVAVIAGATDVSSVPVPAWIGPTVYWSGGWQAGYASGDTRPTGTAVLERYLVEPVFTP